MIPCYGEVDFDQYDEYFRARFDASNRDHSGRLVVNLKAGGTRYVRLWNNLELFGRDFLSELAPEGFRLGEHAILLQVVRFKSTEGWLGGSSTEKSRALEHQRSFTESLLNEGCIRVLVPMGNQALAELRRIRRFDSLLPESAAEGTGQSYRGTTRAGKTVTVCPVKHMSYPPSVEAKRALAEELYRVLEGTL